MNLRRHIRSITALTLTFSMLVLIFTPLFGTASRVDAASGSQFQADRIMDDSIFYAGANMTVSDIQGFMNSKVPTCDTNHTRTGSANDSGPPYICLKDYHQDMPAKSADSYCSGSIGAVSNASSAQILYEVSRACNVSAKVLLVLLQKEQSLVTDTWPWAVQYRSATGYGCPDTAPCDAEYYGYFNQVYNAARQFERYVKQAGSYNYRVGRNSYVQYNPNTGCGGTNITIQTQATAALYNYTPYQPNAAALNNLYGTGDGCSAYGNRNFWRMYNDWFGPTTSDSTANVLSFIRLNHSSGNVESIGYSSISSYSYPARNTLTSYPAVAPDGAVVPLFWPPNGDLVFLRLNHTSGNVELVSYSAGSNFKQLANYSLAAYPAVAPDGAVVPLFWPPNGDLVFLRLNHTSGNVELVSYSAGSNFKQLANYSLAAYPAVAPDGAVVPLFWPPNGDLSFIRLNHSSGNVEIVTYSASSNFKKVVNYSLSGYPAVPADGSVIPIYTPNGDLSFIRLNHNSGNVEIVTYSASSNFKQIIEHDITSYPAVAPDGAVVPGISR